MRNAILVGKKAIPIHKNRIISTTTKESGQIVEKQVGKIFGSAYNLARALLLGSWSSKKTYKKEIFPLIGRGSKNYYHWVLEYLPKLRCLRYCQKASPNVLIKKNPQNWKKQSLKCAGIKRYLEWENGIAKVENLLLSSHRMQLGGNFGVADPSMEDILWLRKEIKPSRSVSVNERENIYIEAKS